MTNRVSAEHSFVTEKMLRSFAPTIEVTTMRTIAYTIAIGAVLLLAGCKDNPVAPSSPAPLPAEAQLSASALTLFSQGKDVVTAATVLNSEYGLGADAVTNALYNAGYTPQDLAKAIKVVFKESPHAHAKRSCCESMCASPRMESPTSSSTSTLIRSHSKRMS